MLDGDAPNEAYLGAGSLLGRYCHTHHCDNVPEVNQLQKKIAAPLAKGCKAPSLTEEDKVIEKNFSFVKYSSIFLFSF